MNLRKHFWGLLSLTLACLILGCPAGGTGGPDPDNTDDDLDAVAVVVGDNFGLALREGSTVGTQEVAICGGWFPEVAQHALTIQSGLSMTIRVISTGDARLWVLCGQSNYCGEEVAAGTWEISRFWNTAVCDVYVGTASENAALDYELEFEAD